MKQFKDFEPFINNDGLTKITTERVGDILRGLHKETGELWEPGNCRRVPEVKTAAEEIPDKSGLDMTVSIRRYGENLHFWLEGTGGEFEEKNPFVIDPFGIPIKRDDALKLFEGHEVQIGINYRPYFGLRKENRKNYARQIYAHGEPFNEDWGVKMDPINRTIFG